MVVEVVLAALERDACDEAEDLTLTHKPASGKVVGAGEVC